MHHRPPPRAGPFASPARPYSPPCAPRAAPNTCAPQRRSPVTPPTPPASPSYRNCPCPESSSHREIHNVSQPMQLGPTGFSNMEEGPTESCIIIEEEIERVETIDFPDNMQNVKKEVKLVRPYGVVIQSIEEVIEALPPGAERPPEVQRIRRKITRSAGGARGAGGAGGAGAGPPTSPTRCDASCPRNPCDSASAASVDPSATWRGGQY